MNHTGPRRCGSGRTAGGIYNAIDLGADGMPIEFFLFCPVLEIPADLKLSPQGIGVFEKDGIAFAADMVGTVHYPFVPDFLMEGLNFGFSRRFPKTTDFTKFTQESRHLLAHARARIDDPFLTRLYEFSQGSGITRWGDKCPKSCAEHEFKSSEKIVAKPGASCLRLLWETMQPGKGDDVNPDDLMFKRYGAKNAIAEGVTYSFFASQPCDNLEVTFQPGFFMWLPLKFEVVYDAENGTHEEAIKALKGCPIDWNLVDDREVTSEPA